MFKNVQSKCLHEKRHSGIQKYPCTECTKAFCSKADFMKHSRTHKKSECNYCKKEVIEYKMNVHIEKEHKLTQGGVTIFVEKKNRK